MFRLKGIACTDSSEGRSAPTRFRSNSVPIPKIEVTLYSDDNTHDSPSNQGGSSNKTKDPNDTNIEMDIPEICIEDNDDDVFPVKGRNNLSTSASTDESPHHIRSISMREGLKKKRKSIIHSIEHTKLKNFKSFVESKILSKSSMDMEKSEAEEASTISSGKLGLTRKRTCEGRFHASVSTLQI